MKFPIALATVLISSTMVWAENVVFNITISNTTHQGQRIDLNNGGDLHWFARLAPAGDYSGQKWHIEPATDDGFWLNASFSTAQNCMSVREDKDWKGAHMVAMMPCGAHAHQTWEFEIDDAGDVKLINPDFGGNQCLTAGAPNEPLVVATCGSRSGQVWHFDVVN